MSDEYWEEMEEKAASEICLNLDDEILHNITGAWTTQQIWKKLEGLNVREFGE